MSEYLAPQPVYFAGQQPHYQKVSENDSSDRAPLVYNAYNPYNPESEIPRPGRTPSPTPSEFNALHGPQGLKRFANKKFLTSREGIITILIYTFILAIVILTSIFQTQIVDALLPVTTWLKARPWGFLIPGAILVVLSFPPLFGQEIVEIIVGITYGLWVGFAITVLSRGLGEILNFFVFKYACGPRFEKMQKKNYGMASLAQIIKEGGFKMILLLRYSAIPPHLTTALFATTGEISFWVFLAALVLSAPRIFIDVLMGVYYGMEAQDVENHDTNDPVTKKYEVMTYVVLAITIVITIVAMRYIKPLQQAAKEDIIYKQRKARQVVTTPYDNGAYPPLSLSHSRASSQTMFNHDESEYAAERIPKDAYDASRPKFAEPAEPEGGEEVETRMA